MMNKIYFLVFVALFGCSTTQNNEEKMDNKLTYLALGDSYTIGESVDQYNLPIRFEP